jgi:ankyrin repeat protein
MQFYLVNRFTNSFSMLCLYIINNRSLGVLLYAMLCGSLPFNARSIPLLIKKIVEGKFKFPKFLSANAKSLISSILQIQPELRPKLMDIMKHPWVQEHLNSANNNDANTGALAQSYTISRPEIISPDTDSHRRPAEIQKFFMHNNNAQNLDDDNALPPGASLRFPIPAELEFYNPNNINNTNVPQPVVQASQTILEEGTPTDNKCKNCGKLLNIPGSNGLFTVHTDKNAGLCNCNIITSPLKSAINPEEVKSPNQPQQSALAEKLLAEKAKIMNTLSPQTPNSNNTTQNTSTASIFSPITIDAEDYNGTLHFGLITITNDDSNAISIRDDYFHPDDTKRKQKIAEYERISKLSPQQQEQIRIENEKKLFEAAQSGDLQTVIALIEPEIDEKTGSVLAPALCDIRATTTDRYTVLHYASEFGYINIAQALLASMQPFDINARTVNNFSPLMLAAKSGHELIVKLLIKYGAAIHISNTEGKSAIFLARENGFPNIAQLLTEASSLRHRRHTRLHLNQNNEKNEAESIRTLNSEFLRAVEAGDIEKVRHLLNLSITMGDVPEVQRVLTRRGSDKTGLTKEQIAEKARLEAEIEAKKPKYSIDIHAKGIDNWSCLHFAARKNRYQIMSLLLQHSIKPDVNSLTKNGWTPLHLAADRGSIDCCKLLIQSGADATIQSNQGLTAAKLAAEGKFIGLANYLFQVEKEQLAKTGANTTNGHKDTIATTIKS